MAEVKTFYDLYAFSRLKTNPPLFCIRKTKLRGLPPADSKSNQDALRNPEQGFRGLWSREFFEFLGAGGLRFAPTLRPEKWDYAALDIHVKSDILLFFRHRL
jgi:hypothetical protein